MTDTPAPFLLTPRLVAEKALPLLIEGKLGNQLHPEIVENRSRCFYRHPGDGSPCVVGAALPDDVATRAESAGSVTALAEYGIIRCDDVRIVRGWQVLHDFARFDELRTALEAELAKSA